MTTKHKLGWRVGTMIENDDGTVSFRRAGHLRDSFRVRVADVTGFSETKDGKYPLERRIHLFGRGGEILSASVNTGHTRVIEQWFRARPEFGGGAEAGGVVGDLERLAKLRDSGALTEEEFQAQKTKLLG